jgi:esterase
MRLAFRKYGDGPPMVILHGLYGSADNWVTFAKGLKNSYTIFIPDQRNHGNSPHSNMHDYNHMCADLEEFAAANVGSSFILLGHSMGGKTAMTFAFRNPSMLFSLIVADISPFNRHNEGNSIARSHEKILKTLLSTDITSYKSRSQVEKLFEKSIGDERVSKFLLKNLDRAPAGQFTWKLNVAAIYNNLDSLMAGIPVEDIDNQQITGFPALFLRGGDSNYLPESHFPGIMKLFPAATIKTIGGTGHWLHAEKPDEFLKIVKNFLEGDY